MLNALAVALLDHHHNGGTKTLPRQQCTGCCLGDGAHDHHYDNVDKDKVEKQQARRARLDVKSHNHHRNAHDQPDVVAEHNPKLLGARALHETAVAVHRKVEEGDQEHQGKDNVVANEDFVSGDTQMAEAHGKRDVVGSHHAYDIERPEQQATNESGQLHGNTSTRPRQFKKNKYSFPSR